MFFHADIKIGHMKVVFQTLGCKLNFSETSTIARELCQHGFERVDFSEKADLYVINTCSVTKNAEKKCRKVIRRVVRQSPNAFVAVIGCYAQLKPEEITKIRNVDLILGTKEKLDLRDFLDSPKKKNRSQIFRCDIGHITTFVPSFSLNERTRAFLKIQDGCDYNCAYCTIPLARGASRSDSINNIIQTAKEIAKMDIKEVVLTGVNIGDFGRYTGETFLELIQQLDSIEGIDRIRISSIEPNLLSDKIISFIAQSNRFVPHFHIPLQSGSDRILKLMRRRYNRKLYADRVTMIKTLMPECCIGVDVMVGFPGEIERDFLESFNFISELDVSYLHVFTYSEREKTEALNIQGAVTREEGARRSKILHFLSEKKKRHFYSQHIGEVMSVLFETYHNGVLSGKTKNYIRVQVAGSKTLTGRIGEVKLHSNVGKYVRGELLN